MVQELWFTQASCTRDRLDEALHEPALYALQEDPVVGVP
jgi:hypothetical protein